MVDTTDVLRNGILNSFLCEVEATATRIRLAGGENSRAIRDSNKCHIEAYRAFQNHDPNKVNLKEDPLKLSYSNNDRNKEPRRRHPNNKNRHPKNNLNNKTYPCYTQNCKGRIHPKFYDRLSEEDKKTAVCYECFNKKKKNAFAKNKGYPPKNNKSTKTHTTARTTTKRVEEKEKPAKQSNAYKQFKKNEAKNQNHQIIPIVSNRVNVNKKYISKDEILKDPDFKTSLKLDSLLNGRKINSHALGKLGYDPLDRNLYSLDDTLPSTNPSNIQIIPYEE